MKSSLKRTRSNFVCFVTCSKINQARKIAKTLIKERLAACVNVLKPVESIYRWKEKIVQDKEVLLIIKGNYKKQKRIVQKIRCLHSYEVPEIIFTKIDSGLADYLNWLNETTR